jgi:uncharacterized protein YndB with AHSA1/START domain
MTERSVTHTTFTIDRIYSASPAKVFRAFSDPVAKRRWFAEGEGWHIDSYELDFTVGGLETSRFRFGDGPPMRYDAVIQDIVLNERIIIAYSMMIGEKRISASLATTEFKPEASGTRLVFTEQGAYLDGFDQAEGRESGSRQLFERLARELERQA